MLKICCASLPIKQIVEEDMADLKGKWEGIRNSSGRYRSGYLPGLRTVLEIRNDSFPLKASLFFLERKEGIIEYPILFEVVEGKLASKEYGLTLTFCAKGNRLRLKGQMDVGNCCEELVFWKDTRAWSFRPFGSESTSRRTVAHTAMSSAVGRKAAGLRL